MNAILLPGVVSNSATGLDQMALAMIGLPEMLVVLAIVVVLFGASKLPALGRGMGEAIGNFKKAQRDAIDEANADERNDEIDATPHLSSASIDGEFEKKATEA